MTMATYLRTGAAFLATALAAFVVSPVAHAGALYFDLVIDPATTAGAGIAAIPVNGSNLVVTSTRSGAGTWHLYAIDDVDGSYGIRSFNVKLNPGAGGTIPSIFNRSPNTLWYDLDGNGSFNAGFSDMRSSLASAITGAQDPSSFTPQIGGFGISASDFRHEIPIFDSLSPRSSGLWGRYADFGGAQISLQTSGHSRYPLFLAEGTYTGAPPTVDLLTPAANGGTNVAYWTDTNLTTSASATQYDRYSPCFCAVVIDYQVFNSVNPNSPGFIDYTFTYVVDMPFVTPDNNSKIPLIWSDFSAFEENPPASPATFDPATHTFHWNTLGTAPGRYRWSVKGTVPNYLGVWNYGMIFVTVIPEPSTFVLAISLVPCVSSIRSRRCG